jgi:hypothetical protein
MNSLDDLNVNSDIEVGYFDETASFSWVRLFGASMLALFAANGLQQAP